MEVGNSMFIQSMIRSAKLACSVNPIERRRAEIEAEIKAADVQRGMGVMASLSRGSVLLQREEVFLGELRQQRGR
jgi:uncharacterized protein YjcR